MQENQIRFEYHEEINIKGGGNYCARVYSTNNKSGRFFVELVNSHTGDIIHSYYRTYPCLFRTIDAFRYKNSDYIIFSDFTTALKIISVASKEIIEVSTSGFCPTEVFVPSQEDITHRITGGQYLPFMLVAGCLWGDDSSWKIQYLSLEDLSRPLKLEEKFGYLELASGCHLKEDVVVEYCDAFEADGHSFPESIEIHIPMKFSYYDDEYGKRNGGYNSHQLKSLNELIKKMLGDMTANKVPINIVKKYSDERDKIASLGIKYIY